MTWDEQYAEPRKNRATWWDQSGKLKVSDRVLNMRTIFIPSIKEMEKRRQKDKGIETKRLFVHEQLDDDELFDPEDVEIG